MPTDAWAVWFVVTAGLRAPSCCSTSTHQQCISSPCHARHPTCEVRGGRVVDVSALSKLAMRNRDTESMYYVGQLHPTYILACCGHTLARRRGVSGLELSGLRHPRGYSPEPSTTPNLQSHHALGQAATSMHIQTACQSHIFAVHHNDHGVLAAQADAGVVHRARWRSKRGKCAKIRVYPAILNGQGLSSCWVRD